MQGGDEHMDFDLLTRYLTGETGPAENAAIEVWLAESPDHREALEELRQVLEAADSVKPGTNVDTDAAWAKVQQQMSKPEKGKVVQMPASNTNRQWRLAALAAVFVGVIAIAGALLYFTPSENSPVKMATVITGSHTTTDTLPDGTVVTLNKNSTISYPKEFTGNQRLVSLTGEAFFEVARDTTKPFIIDAGQVDVTVLGTSFNVKAYEAAGDVEVVVATGKVQVTDETRKVILNAGDKAQYTAESKQLEVLMNDDIDYQFWRLKKLVFANTSLSEVIDVLNRQYQAKLSLENDAAAACRFTATFEDDSLQTILDVLTATFTLELEETANGRILKGNACDANSL